jgi:hypothetical protein
MMRKWSVECGRSEPNRNGERGKRDGKEKGNSGQRLLDASISMWSIGLFLLTL